MSETADLTRNQSLVLDTLTGATGPLSAYGILDRVRGDGIKAPLQIYRALDKLVEMGLAHRLESLNAFVACAHADEHHEGLAAFAICESCGRVDEFADEVVEERLAAWSRSTGFKTERTTIEIRGHCKDCAAGRSG
ncbi:MAG: Fur family transcriptional regulator [Devosia sp.]